jgi:hypothetical protein
MVVDNMCFLRCRKLCEVSCRIIDINELSASCDLTDVHHEHFVSFGLLEVCLI